MNYSHGSEKSRCGAKPKGNKRCAYGEPDEGSYEHIFNLPEWGLVGPITGRTNSVIGRVSFFLRQYLKSFPNNSEHYSMCIEHFEGFLEYIRPSPVVIIYGLKLKPLRGVQKTLFYLTLIAHLLESNLQVLL